MKAVIKKLSFSVLSHEDILNMSAIELTSFKMEEPNSISDLRLGISGSNNAGLSNSMRICPTCCLDEISCPGHFGYISLKYPIIHPLFVKYVVKILKMFCFNCARFMFVNINGSFPSFENVVIEKAMCPHCCSHQPAWILLEDGLRIKLGNVLEMTPAELKIILTNLNKSDLKAISVTSYPENFIITLLPICPPCIRPPLHIDGQLHDDHLTIQYNEIIKINANLDKADDYMAELKKLSYKISNLFTLKGKAGSKAASIAAKPYQTRLSGKKGYMRDSIMGKRVDKSGRTVIGPEPTLLINQVAIPEAMAKILTVEEIVTEHNIHLFSETILNTDDIYFIYRNCGGNLKSFNASHINSDFKLKIGDKLDRRMKNGDMVEINRQPTLHLGSMIAFETVVHSSNTICFNLSNTKTFNADFDGDEMNIHVPQSYNTKCELQELSSVKNHLLSQRNGHPNIVLVQDNILSLYLMSFENTILRREQFFDLMMFLVDEQRKCWSFKRITDMLKKLETVFGADKFCSRGVISMCLPQNFDYKSGTVVIEKGIFKEGLFDKKLMNSIFNVIFHIYDSDVSEMVVNNLQILSNHWLKYRGFTVGYKDCLLKNSGISGQISDIIEKSMYEADITGKSLANEKIREIRIQEILNNAHSACQKIARGGFSADNNFISMIESGSKGDYFNVVQISGLLGQQYLKGARIANELNNDTRSLYHNPLEENEKYKTRGFVCSNFYKGLSPRDMYFHGVAGRSGVVDTAMGTSDTGYMQRRIVKLTEILKFSYDRTVRDDMNNITQFSFGNGFDVTKSPDSAMIDILASRLNNDYEEINTAGDFL